MEKILEKIIFGAIDGKVSDSEAFLTIVKENLKGQNMADFPSNIILRKTYQAMVKEGKVTPNKVLEKILVTKKMRSLSGVSVITVLTKPFPCPGKCLYCPTEKDVPKSYLSSEPAVMRAILCGYDPYKQVRARLDSLELEGHPTDKVELIVIGGTFSALPRDYQEEYVKRCFEALNDQFPKNFSVIPAPDRVEGKAPLGIQTVDIDSRLRGNDNLQEAKRLNETAKHRCVGLTLETRPDYITEEEVEWFRYLGATRVELGVQSVFDDVLEHNKRGHKVEEAARATKLLKDAGFKICYHMMPGLPGSDLCRDLEMFKTIFSDERFQPDYIKIYPCVVTKGSELYDLWKAGKYRPYTDDELEDLICEIKKIIPYRVRIMRLIRDIPSGDIEAGSKISNLRQNAQRRLAREGKKCKCIRCREIGQIQISNLKSQNDKSKSKMFKEEYKTILFPVIPAEAGISRSPIIVRDNKKGVGITLFRDEYEASGGRETFLSYESDDRSVLYALLRLKLSGDTFLDELKGCAIVRELHTYGQQIEIGKDGDTQHRGLGKKLLKEAEKIAKKEGYKKVAVISGIGVRDYYKKLGYKLNGEYMAKDI